MHHNPKKKLKQTWFTVQCYKIDGCLRRILGHLRTQSTSHDQFVVSKALAGLIMHAYDDHVMVRETTWIQTD